MRRVLLIILPIIFLTVFINPVLSKSAPLPEPRISEAHWIWMSGIEDKPGTIYLRKLINLPARPISAMLQASADDEYKIWINGMFAVQNSPKSSDNCSPLESFDVTKLLAKGDNYIVVQATNLKDKGGFLAALAIVGADRSITYVNTDSSWEASLEPGENWQQSPSGGEWQPCSDLGVSAVTPPWFCPSAPSALKDLAERSKIVPKSEVINPVSAKISPQTTAPVFNFKATQEEGAIGSMRISPESADQKAVVVVDFGTIIMGRPIIIGKSDDVYSMEITLGELEKDLENPRHPIINKQDVRGGIRFTTKEPASFRYVKVSISSPRIVDIERIQAESISGGEKELGSFECSDDLLNEIWKVSGYTLRACTKDYYVVSSKRNDTVRAGDMRVQALAGYYTFGNVGVAKRSLILFAEMMFPDGLMPTEGPNLTGKYECDQALLWVIALADYYRHTGNTAMVDLLFPYVERLLKWFEANSDENGMFVVPKKPGISVFIDNDSSLEKNGYVAPVQMLYHWALNDAATLAVAAKNKKAQRNYLAHAAKLRKAINAAMWAAEMGGYVDCVENGVPSSRTHGQTNALAVLSGVPSNDIKAALSSTLADGEKTTPVLTPYMNFYIASALFESGKPVEALNLIRAHWGGMIKRGASTFWEQFDPSWPDPYENTDFSFCHGWSTGIAQVLPAYVAGIRPKTPGFDTVLIAPELGGLQFAKAEYRTTKGAISVEWKADRGCPTGTIEIPLKHSAYVMLPIPPEGSFYTLDGKRFRYRIDNGKIAFQVKGGKKYSIGLGDIPKK